MRFILVDEILAMEPGKRVHGVKTMAPDEDLFRDHFPAFPVVPGLLSTELYELAAAAAPSCTAAGWKEGLSRAEREVVEYIAGDLMRQCGYSVETGGRSSKPARLSIAEALDRAERVLRRRLNKAAARLNSHV